MHPENGDKEKVPGAHEVVLPESLAEGFLDGTLDQDRVPIQSNESSRTWRLFEQEVDVPNLGKVLLRVDYRQFRNDDLGEHFDQVRFDYVLPEPDEHGMHPRIAEMHWYIEKGESGNPYPFDLMQVHRYVVPEYRDRKGVGRHLYEQSERWAQQVADKKGESLRLALSTDQPLTMDWAEGLGYAPYPEEAERRTEVLEHPERFDLVTETDSMGQSRNPALMRDGEKVRIWFAKTLSAR